MSLVCECGEPAVLPASYWRAEALLPRFEIEEITVVEESWFPGVYLVGNDFLNEGGYISYILKYDGYNLTYDYIIEYEQYGAVRLETISFWGNKGWVGGGKAVGEVYKPLLLTRGSNGWREINVGGAAISTIKDIFPINENSFWCLALRKNNAETGIFKFNGQEFVYYPQTQGVQDGFYLPMLGVFALKWDYYTGTNTVICSATGARWYKEKIPPRILGYEIERVVALTGTANELYLVCTVEREYYAILKRNGPLGKGKYEPVFLSNNSANFGGLKYGAFDGKGRAVFVGNETSLYFDGQSWQLEQLLYPLVIQKVVGSPGGGFWAYGENLEVLGRWELLFHP